MGIEVIMVVDAFEIVDDVHTTKESFEPHKKELSFLLLGSLHSKLIVCLLANRLITVYGIMSCHFHCTGSNGNFIL